MFIRSHSRRHRGILYQTFSLVRNDRTPEGPRQEIIATLGADFDLPKSAWRDLVLAVEDLLRGKPVDPPPPREVLLWAERICRSIRRRSASTTPPESATGVDHVALNDFTCCGGCEIGPVNVLRATAQRLGLETILQRSGLTGRLAMLAQREVFRVCLQFGQDDACLDTFQPSNLPPENPEGAHRIAEPPMQLLWSTLAAKGVPLGRSLTAAMRKLYPEDEGIRLGGSFLERDDPHRLYAPGFGGGRAEQSDTPGRFLLDERGVVRAIEPPMRPVGGSRTEEDLAFLQRESGDLHSVLAILGDEETEPYQLDDLTARSIGYLLISGNTERMPIDWEHFPTQWAEVTRYGSPLRDGGRVWFRFLPLNEGLVLLALPGKRAPVHRTPSSVERRFEEAARVLIRRVRRGEIGPEAEIERRIQRLKVLYPKAARNYRFELIGGRVELERSVEEMPDLAELAKYIIARTNRRDIPEERLWELFRQVVRTRGHFNAWTKDWAPKRSDPHESSPPRGYWWIRLMAYILVRSVEHALEGGPVQGGWSAIREALRSHQRVTMRYRTPEWDWAYREYETEPDAVQREIYRRLAEESSYTNVQSNAK